MSRRSHRHPYVEAAVFAAAAVLAAFIARELWLRRPPASPAAPPQPADIRAVALPPRPALEPASQARTETAVTGVAPIKLTRVQRRPRKTEPVPAPR